MIFTKAKEGNSMEFYVKQYRDKKRFTLEALAKCSGISKSTIERIEKGKSIPNIMSLHFIAKALDVPVTTLYKE